MSIYGIPDQDDLKQVYEHVIEIQTILDNHRISRFIGDNLITLHRNLSFTYDDKFMAAFANNLGPKADEYKMWRLHTYCWVCRSALSVPGDFVECWVYRGFYSAVMTEYLSFETLDKRLLLYDTFEELVEEYSTEDERIQTNPYFDMKNWHEDVVERFRKFGNVEVIKGAVPDVFKHRAPDRVAFLHLDMNAAAAEIAALETLFDRVSAGGMILMDDFGRADLPKLVAAHYPWMEAQNHQILELPTGQGLVIKRGPA